MTTDNNNKDKHEKIMHKNFSTSLQCSMVQGFTKNSLTMWKMISIWGMENCGMLQWAF